MLTVVGPAQGVLTMPTKHDETASRLAKRNGVEYIKGLGADVMAPNRVIEVETVLSVKEGPEKLRGYRMPVYIAGADAKATKAALDVARGTTIGVMNSQGKIVKPSSRGR